MTDQPTPQECSQFLKALADPHRLQILRCLQAGPLSVSDVAQLLEMDLANVSHHLRLMLHTGLVESERDGRFIYYQISPKVQRLRHANLLQFDFGCCRFELEPGNDACQSKSQPDALEGSESNPNLPDTEV